MRPQRWLPASAVLLLAATPIAAQHTTGSLHGTVTDATGVPVAKAVVMLIGTPFRASTDSAGRYRFNALPAATYSIDVEGTSREFGREPPVVHVSAGREHRADLSLQGGVVTLVGDSAGEPLGSETLLDRSTLGVLPITEAREAIAVLPGVTGAVGGAITLRGSPPSAAAVYIDGALVSGGLLDASFGALPLSAIEQLTVTTGPLDAATSGQSGAIGFITRSGGPDLRADLRYRTDDVGFDPWRSVGRNLLEASLEGPLGPNLTFFTALTLDGRASLESEWGREVDAPVWVASGVDTVVHQPVSFGDPFSDTVDVAIPRFVQYSGYCDAVENSGTECQGLRVPFTARGTYSWAGKLRLAYGTASHLSLTGLAAQTQQRDYPGENLYNPGGRTGSSARGTAAILDWTHGAWSGRSPLTLNVNLSYQSDRRVSGPLTVQSEFDSRDPFGGFLVSPLDFLVGLDATHDVTIAGTTYRGAAYLGDTQIQCLLAGTATCIDLIPFLDRDDLGSAQPYRLNPYGAEQSARLPLFTSGVDVTTDLSRETRWQGRGILTWRPGGQHRVRLGVEQYRFDTKRYMANLLSTSFMSAYHEKPVSTAVFADYAAQAGALSIVAGVRYDRFDTQALYPVIPGRISTASGSIVLDGEPITFAPFDPLDPTANLIPAQVHSSLSPRVRATLAVARGTVARFSAARQVGVPGFDDLFTGKNTDISVSNPNQVFGSDVGLMAETAVELGMAHAFSGGVIVDAATFSKTGRSEAAYRIERLPDPGQGGTVRDFRVLAKTEPGPLRGIGISLTHQFSGVLAGSVAYSYWTIPSQQVSSGVAPAPLLPRPGDDGHTVTGWLRFVTPPGWRSGTVVGSVMAGTEAAMMFRWTSGSPYTRIGNSGLGNTTGDEPLAFMNLEPISSSTLPWTKTIDLRITRGFALGRMSGRVFGESQNLFNWGNVLDLFIETGETTNTQHRDRFVSEQVANLESQAGATGWIRTDATGTPFVDFTAGSCDQWQGRNTPGSAASGPVDCVLLMRAEGRYGNGDGLYTRAEYTAAFGAWYDLAYAPYRFYGPGRRIRLGVELSF